MDSVAAIAVARGGARFRRPLLLIVAALAAAGSVPFCAARLSAAPLEIATDTVWQGNVDVVDEVRVLKGATLLIQPGTTIRFAPTKDAGGQPTVRLYVNGSIIAQGTAGRPITFASAAREPRPGDWGGIVVENSGVRANRLSHVIIRHALIGLSGMHAILLAENTVFSDNVKGMFAYQEFNGWIFQGKISGNEFGLHFHQNSAFDVENCEITGNLRAGILLALNSSPKIRSCTIADNGESGIHVVQGSSPLIEGNTISGSRRGISLELQTRPRIVRNLITGNETGVSGEKMVFPLLEGNVVTGNGTGIYCNFSAYMVIHGNNLHDNRTFGLVVGDNMSILMQNKIPYRFLGKFSFDAPPPGAGDAPHQSRRLDPFPENAGVVDARANWWGTAAAAEMAELGENGNISVIEDFFDKPETYYQEEIFRRDRVAFAPWEKSPIAGAGPPPRDYSGVGGKVFFGGKPVAGVRVHAYIDEKDGFRGEGHNYSSPTDADGSFSLNLPAGTYYLIAKGPAPPFPFNEPGDGAFFGYYRDNPVTVSPAAKRTDNLQVVRRAAPVVTAGGNPQLVRVDGVVLGPSGPVAGAAIHVYTDASGQFRGPDRFGLQSAVVGRTDTKGAFSTDLPSGSYFIVASKRTGSDLAAPFQPGDLYGYYDGNPLAPEPGTKTAIIIQVVEGIDATTGNRQDATSTP